MRQSRFVRFMLSKEATVSAISLLLLFCFIIGFTGNRELVYTWVFTLILLYFQTVLIFVLFRGRRQFIRHIGLLTAVSSAFWGAPDSETVKVWAVEGVSVQEAYGSRGGKEWLPHEIILKDVRTETWENGQPSLYEADLEIDGRTVSLKVNHPYPLGFREDVYLSSMGDGYCVLQIVREPWKYGVLAGIILMLAGAFLLFIEGPRGRKKMEE